MTSELNAPQLVQKEISAPQEHLLPTSNEPLLPANSEQEEFGKLMGIINQLSGMDKRNEIVKEYRGEVKQKEEDLKKENFTNFTDMLVIKGQIRDFGKLKYDLQSEGVIDGMTLSESNAYRQKIRKELLDVLGLDETSSDHRLSQDLQDKITYPLGDKAEKVYKQSVETKAKLEETVKIKLIDVLEDKSFGRVIFDLEKGIKNAVESNKNHANYEEAEKAFMDNCLTIFTSNPDNQNLMNEIILNNGEKFFLDTVKEHVYKKVSGTFPVEDQERVKKTVSDKIDFNYGQHKLQQFISKNPEIGNLINKAKWLEYYSQSEGRMRESLERLKLQISDSKIDFNSNIEIGKKQVIPHKDNAVIYEYTLDEVRDNLQKADVEIKDSQAQIIILQNELHNLPKEGFFNKEKIRAQREEMSQKIEDYKKSIHGNHNLRMKLSAQQHQIYQEVSQIQECINRVGFDLEPDTKMTIDQFISKIDTFMKNPKFSDEEKKMAKKYVDIRLSMDKIANKHFFHKEYSYWVGDEQGENNILGWEHIGK